MRIEPYDPRQLDAVIRLSLRAWAPVFDSIQNAMDFDVYREFYPDWRVSQQKAVEEVCADADTKVWVAMAERPPSPVGDATRTAIDSGSTVGFVAVKLHLESSMGEIYMIAVDPDYQRRGIGAALTQFALDWMKVAGMSVAMVETGGDPGHAPARYTYEKMGFRLLPIARYFKKL
jgi:ribosomal protein S18 acetylase RimI-like enzyme